MIPLQFMYEGKSHALFARYAVPQMVGLLFNSVYLIVDGVFIGHRLGREAMAAAAVSVPFIEILLSIAIATASGAGIIISRNIGREEKADAVRTFNVAIWILIAAGGAIVLLGNLFLYPLANLLGATPEIQGDAVTYLRYIVTFSPFLLFSFLLSGLVRNDGRPKLAMFALTFGSVSNIVLDYVFLYPLNMGIGGAALATAIGPVFSVLILLPHFLRKRGTLHFAKPILTWCSVKRILSLGFPSFIMEFTIGMVTLVYNFAIVKHGYGELGLAAYLVIGYMMLIVLTVFLGLAEGLQPVFSYFTGTNEKMRSRQLRIFSTKIFFILGIVCYLLIVLFARGFFMVFSPNDVELVNFAHSKSLVYFSGFFLAGYNLLMISFWQSIQRTRYALWISLLRSVIAPPLLIFILPALLGKEWMWACHSLSEVLTACCVLFLLVKASRETRTERTENKDNAA